MLNTVHLLTRGRSGIQCRLDAKLTQPQHRLRFERVMVGWGSWHPFGNGQGSGEIAKN
jgi:hypothetical protein